MANALAERYWHGRLHPATWLISHPVTRADLLRIARWIHKHRYPQRSLEWVWIGMFCGWAPGRESHIGASLNYLHPTIATIRQLTELLRPHAHIVELGAGRGLWGAILQHMLPASRYWATDSGMYEQTLHYTPVAKLDAKCAVHRHAAHSPVLLWIFPNRAVETVAPILTEMRKSRLHLLILVTYMFPATLRKACGRGKPEITQHRLTDSLCYGDLWDAHGRAVEKLTATTPRRAHLYSIRV